MKKIAVVTSTRADYGLLKNTIDSIYNDDSLNLLLIATGTHLLKEFGYTVQEIESDKYPISYRVEIMMASDSPSSISKTMGQAFMSFSDIFYHEKPDMLVVLGDRYEILPICACAVNACLPIAHISGGEVTEGAVDDCYRHAITKMSYLHFPGCETYRQRIIQLGESPERVFNFGDVGVETVKNMKTLSKKELSDELGIDLDSAYACVTFHPVTLELESAATQVDALLEALSVFHNIKYIFTYANADVGGAVINQKIDEFTMNHSNAVAYKSLGIKKYISCLKHASFVIGNSSSGIVETPVFGIPTINIGDRQKGRLKAQNIIDSKPDFNNIVSSIRLAISEPFRHIAKNAVNPYGYGNTSAKIVATIKYFLENDEINLKKTFYDMPTKDGDFRVG